MQLLPFALLGLAAAAPTTPTQKAQDPPKVAVDTPALSRPELTTCPDLNGALVRSPTANQNYNLHCGSWVDAPQSQLIKIVDTPPGQGYKGCLAACDAEPECGVSQYIATDVAQTNGSCTLFKKGVQVKEGDSDSWTLAIKMAPLSAGVVEGSDKFTLQTDIWNGTELVNASVGVKALGSALFLGGPASNASCDGPVVDDLATFYINNGSLFLYAASATPQQVWVDRSGMGQGVTGYTTGAQPVGRNSERQNFTLDASSGGLTFNGTPAVACPPGELNPQAGWRVGFTSSLTPAWSLGCLPVLLRAVEVEKPVGCLYTQQQQ